MGGRRGALALTAALALAVAGCGGSTVAGDDNGSGDSDAPIKIGFMVPLSGVYATIGEDLERAMQVYLSEHDDTVGGREIELVTIDEGSTPQEGTAAARRLVQQEQVAAVTGIVNTATAVGVAEVFSDAEIPVISTGQVTDNPYWWRIGWTNPMMNQSIVDHLVEEEGDASVYLIAADYAQGHAIVEDVRAGLEDGGVEIAGEAFTPFGTTQDFQPYLSDIQNSDATVVYAFYAGAEAVSFVTQYSQFGLDEQAQLYGNQALTEGGLAAQGTAAEGVLTNSSYTPHIDSEVNRAFVEAYQAEFDALPSVYSEAQYASVVVLGEAIAAAGDGDVTGAAINDALGGLGEVETPRGSWRFDDAQAPTQTIYLRRATEQADGQMADEVLTELGVYSSQGERS